MFCSSCGSPTPVGARFCNACGAALAPGASGPQAMVPAVSTPVALMRVVPCPHCGSVAPPTGYFSKPIHIVILIGLTTFYFFPGLFYFLSRKDRLVCNNCGTWRAGGTTLAAAQAFREGRILEGTTGLMLPEKNESAERALDLARKSKRSAVFWGVVSAGSLGLAFASGVGFVVPALVGAAIAVHRLTRGTRLEEKGYAKKRSHQAMRILQLAQARRGVLTVSEVAASLNLPLPEAERALDGMVDGLHVEMEVSDEGRVTYVFPELQAALERKPVPVGS